ncbi:uncharacterized protein LTR77_010484 [Saxophila tyrrhenica]|uniref:Heme haloperoxidase family profile domain-containing protein n=1 Tax=Saxophila tyrrhenica TaxID=1690608 RepID=A0AAV9NVH8_9PEZI|nr:hypothetical protein LTR77_010484 [Saxophila tyrrhenica]
MRVRSFFVPAFLIAASIAFPAHHIQEISAGQDGLLGGLLGGLLNAGSDVVEGIAQKLQSTLNALGPLDTSKPINVHGVHAFHPPTETDQRGPCPGLNALANHGYISRDGIVSLLEVVPAINRVYGMSLDLALALGVMGVVWTGNSISLDPSFSIGGNDTAVSNALGNLQGVLGTPQGIDYSHNFIEADSSPTRNDLYLTGNAWTMNMSRFQELYDSVPARQNFNFDVMAKWASKRFHDSVETNPYFYYGPFTGMVARNAGYLFITRLFASYDQGSSEGVLTHDTLKSFFGVRGDGSNMRYKEGWERIPSNWYRNPVDYGLTQLNLDTVQLVSKYPELGNIGGNTGSTDSFTGVDMDDVLGGVLNADQLLEDNSLMCFALEVVKLASPNYLNNLYSTLAEPLELIKNSLATPLLSLSCPEWRDLTMGGKPLLAALENEFPGAQQSLRAL